MKLATGAVAVLGRDDDAVAAELSRLAIGMSVAEARKLTGILGRDPSRAEAFLFDVAWSEHCSYKSSRSVLRDAFGGLKDPRYVVLGPGEDAGVFQFTTWEGEPWCVVMGHESHNHPSQVLPLEGAATGIGGIVRDVYCMGAEVVGVLDALRFGDPTTTTNGPAVSEIARGVVEGIWRYGNALGVPNLGGDIYFDRGFDDNCLVNVVAIGVCPQSRIIRSRVPDAAEREPYVAILVGKPTDASGFGGASFASTDLAEDDAARNVGAVQVADPFLKRVLAEANRVVLDDMFERGVSIGFKDLGAGGIGGAAIEIADAGSRGIEIELDNVRTGVDGLEPEVILVGETQERFVWAVPESEAARVIDVYERQFELPELHPGAGAVVLGRFTNDGMVRVRHRGATIVDCSARALTEGIAYTRAARAPAARPPRDEGVTPLSAAEAGEAFSAMLAHPDGASRGYVYRNYDSDVQGRTVFRPGDADAGVIAPIDGAPVGVAIAVDGNPHRGLSHPYQAGAWAVAGAVRNVACVGARPLALSDCLNFGNPERPETFWQFKEAVRGIVDTATALGVIGEPGCALPIVTGNVSFYNQSKGGDAIPPSPIVGCVGVLDDIRDATDIAVKAAGHHLVWAGVVDARLGGTLFARVRGLDLPRPDVDVAVECGLVRTLVDIAPSRRAHAVHDVSEGGLLMCLFDMLHPGELERPLGIDVDLGTLPGEATAALFGEGAQVVLEVADDDVAAVRAAFDVHNVPTAVVGRVVSERRLHVDGVNGERLALDLDAALRVFANGLKRWLG